MRDLIPDSEFDPPEVKARRQLKIEQDRADGGAEFAQQFANLRAGKVTSPTYPCLMELLEKYAAGGTAAPATVKAWRRMIAHLQDFLGHDDASRLSKADVAAWKDFLLIEKGKDGAPVRGAKTVREGYLTALKIVIDESTNTGSLPENVA